MGLGQRIESAAKRFRWYDVGLLRISALVFGLMIAKLWPPILSLDWYWYLVIALVLQMPPLKKLLCNKEA